MREYKFRGKWIFNNQWIYGYLTEQSDHDTGRGKVAIYIKQGEGIPTEPTCWGSYLVDPNTVGQFTGLLDRNGKEIYEGDRVVDEDGNEHIVAFGKIGFDSNWNGLTGFGFKDRQGDDDCFMEMYWGDSASALVVIDTIHESEVE